MRSSSTTSCGRAVADATKLGLVAKGSAVAAQCASRDVRLAPVRTHCQVSEKVPTLPSQPMFRGCGHGGSSRAYLHAHPRLCSSHKAFRANILRPDGRRSCVRTWRRLWGIGGSFWPRPGTRLRRALSRASLEDYRRTKRRRPLLPQP